jgi:spore coat protein U-like protein
LKHYQRLFFLCSLLALAESGWAATATTTFSVTASVTPTCTIAAAPMNFGASIPTPISSNVDSTTTVTATCSSGAAYQVALSAGIGAGATFASRRMTSGANVLSYSLYSDLARGSVWGNGTGGSVVVNNTGAGTAQTLTVYGRITSPQSVLTGTYSDTITVTITF